MKLLGTKVQNFVMQKRSSYTIHLRIRKSVNPVYKLGSGILIDRMERVRGVKSIS